jgi:hypothetical protein
MLALSAFAVLSHTRDALFGVGAAELLLIIGIHNAWDSIAYLSISPQAEYKYKRRCTSLYATELFRLC